MLLLLISLIIILSILLLFTILYILYYFGLFNQITISCTKSPINYNNKKIIYRIEYGNNINDSSFIYTELLSIFSQEYRKNLTTFAIYFNINDEFLQKFSNYIDLNNDKIKMLKNYKLLFMVGAIINDNDNDDNDELKLQSKLLNDKGYHYTRLPEQVDNVLSCKFPYRGILSTVLGNYRCYSLVDQYLQENRIIAYPKIEFYTGDYIYYILPLSKQNDFIELIQMKYLEQLKLIVNNSEDVSNVNQEEKEKELEHEEKHEEEKEEINSEHSSDSSYELVD